MFTLSLIFGVLFVLAFPNVANPESEQTGPSAVITAIAYILVASFAVGLAATYIAKKSNR